MYVAIVFQAPQNPPLNTENGYSRRDGQDKSKECNGASLLSESVLQDVRDDLQLHLNVSALLTLPVMLSAPSLIYWSHNLRYLAGALLFKKIYY